MVLGGPKSGKADLNLGHVTRYPNYFSFHSFPLSI